MLLPAEKALGEFTKASNVSKMVSSSFFGMVCVFFFFLCACKIQLPSATTIVWSKNRNWHICWLSLEEGMCSTAGSSCGQDSLSVSIFYFFYFPNVSCTWITKLFFFFFIDGRCHQTLGRTQRLCSFLVHVNDKQKDVPANGNPHWRHSGG